MIRPVNDRETIFSISAADELIADIIQHIPEKSFQLVRYFGWYSNRMWGERRKQEEGTSSLAW
jgi:Putative transposase